LANVTYFTGAGASFYSLPLIKTMGSRMIAFSRFLKTNNENGIIKNDFALTYISELDNLIEIANDRTSIDAYARELALKNSNIELLRVKSILSSYLIFEQLIKPKELVFESEEYFTDVIPNIRKKLNDDLQSLIKTNIDKRYFTFWGEHLALNSDMPNNRIKIISWNYDMQFEASYSQIKNFSLELAQQNLQVYPSTITNIDTNNFCILKLNGTAGLISAQRKRIFNLFDLREHKLMENIDYLINLLKENYHRSLSAPLFTFAWEDEPLVNQTRQKAIDVIKNTEILVIIGYSFPTFNRDIDRQLFKEIPNLKKIYYQVPKAEIDELIDKLDGINPAMRPLVKRISNLDTFFMPPEI
jgi:hypothetical protein